MYKFALGIQLKEKLNFKIKNLLKVILIIKISNKN